MESSIIVNAFNKMGGNYHDAVSAGSDFDTVAGWITWQASQAGLVGAGAMFVPGVHLAAIVADMAILLHKMAYCAWGVSGVLNVKCDGKDDFAIILGLWSNAIKEDELPEVIAGSGLTAGAAVGMATFAPKVTEKALIKGTGQVIGAGGTAVGKKIGLKSSAKGLGKLTGKLGEKIAAKVAGKITAKLSAKSLAGFIPFVGPVIGGGINAYFVSSLGRSAEIYYTKKKYC